MGRGATSLTFVGTADRPRAFHDGGPASSTAHNAVRPTSGLERASVSSGAIRAALIRRVRISSAIGEEDIKEIEALPISVRQYPAAAPVVRDGERATDCCLIADGFCVRSKTIASGKRQILSIHIPGEIPDLMSLFLHVMDHDLSTLTSSTVAFISHETLQRLHRSPTTVVGSNNLRASASPCRNDREWSSRCCRPALQWHRAAPDRCAGARRRRHRNDNARTGSRP